MQVCQSKCKEMKVRLKKQGRFQAKSWQERRKYGKICVQQRKKGMLTPGSDHLWHIFQIKCDPVFPSFQLSSDRCKPSATIDIASILALKKITMRGTHEQREIMEKASDTYCSKALPANVNGKPPSAVATLYHDAQDLWAISLSFSN